MVSYIHTSVFFPFALQGEHALAFVCFLLELYVFCVLYFVLYACYVFVSLCFYIFSCIFVLRPAASAAARAGAASEVGAGPSSEVGPRAGVEGGAGRARETPKGVNE